MTNSKEHPMTAATRDVAGRFTRAAPHPCCETCGSVLQERLSGDLVCMLLRCSNRGTVVGNSGADVGVLGARAAALTATPNHGRSAT